ncbi:MAG: hypothetical protein ACXW0Z_19620, partial [Gemmatirosa sp.]
RPAWVDRPPDATSRRDLPTRPPDATPRRDERRPPAGMRRARRESGVTAQGSAVPVLDISEVVASRLASGASVALAGD